MIQIDRTRSPKDLVGKINKLFELSAAKIHSLEKSWNPANGAPVFTVQGRYSARGWTEWTEGFQYGSALLQFDATGVREFLDLGRDRTLTRMAPHLTHTGVHDHGFNNVSTYGGLWRMAREKRIDSSDWEVRFFELALKVSGAVQAARWTSIPGGGFIHSFNGAHSLFVDTIRSLRALALAHRLGHRLVQEQDAQVNLLSRLLQHARATAAYNVFNGRGGGPFDIRGRVAHESLFNAANGTYRGTSTQQGYSPFTTWTRGLAWAMLGLAEELNFSRRCRPTRSKKRATKMRSPGCSRRLAPRATSISSGRPAPTVCPTGIPERPDCSRSAIGAAAPRILSTTASRSIVPPRRSPRRGCSVSGASSTNEETGRGTGRQAFASSRRSSILQVPT